MKDPTGTSYTDLVPALLLGLASGVFSGGLSYVHLFKTGAVGLAVFAVIALVAWALGLKRISPGLMVPLLLWPGLFSLEPGFNLAAGAGLVGLGLAGLMMSPGLSWFKRGVFVLSALAIPVVFWLIGLKLPDSSGALIPGRHVMTLVFPVAVASIALLARGDVAKNLIRPTSIALFCVAMAGFLMAYVFLSPAYIAPLRSGADWASLAAVLMFALGLGAVQPELLLVSLLWAGLLGPYGLLVGLVAVGLVGLLSPGNAHWAGWALAGVSALLMGALPWAKQGVFGFISPGLMLATGLVFAGSAAASKIQAKWIRLPVLVSCFLVAAGLSGSLGLAVILLILAPVAGMMSLGKRPMVWWGAALFGLALTGLALLQPWHLKLKPQGVKVALTGRSLYQQKDFPAALVYLSQQQLGPEDFNAAALCAVSQSSDPLPLLQRGLRLYPNDPGLARTLLRYVWKRGRAQDMILWSRRLQSQGFFSPLSMRVLGKGMMLSGRFTDAAQAFLTEFLLGDPDGVLYLADIYQRKPLYQQARRVGADFRTVYQDLINIHLRRQDTARALQYAQALASSYPDDTSLVRLLREISP